MDVSKAAQIEAHARAIAELLHEETESENPQQLESFEGIEQEAQSHLLEHVGSEKGSFLSTRKRPANRAWPHY